jgi:YD repeat-containing protein
MGRKLLKWPAMRQLLSLLICILMVGRAGSARAERPEQYRVNQGKFHVSKEYIRDDSYRIIGSIDTDSRGKQVAYDASFRRLGEYDPDSDSDSTWDSSLRRVGTGNQLSALIWRARK